MKRWLKWILMVITVLVIVFVSINVWMYCRFINSKDDIFITASPVDLTQIARISPFRSGMGHDYSGLNINGIKKIKLAVVLI